MIKIHSNSIEITGVFPSSKDGYFINKSRFKTEANLDFWLSHLGEKNWFSSEIKVELLKTFYQLNKNYGKKQDDKYQNMGR